VKPGRSERQAGKGSTDLWAGVAATVVFLLMASLLGIGWLTVSALLSAGVYVGVRLLLPAPKATDVQAVPTVSPETLLVELRGMAQRLPPMLAARLTQIGNQAEALLIYFRAHPERTDPGLFLTRQHLRMAHTLTQRWMETTRVALQPAPQSAQKLEEFLTDVSSRLTQLYQGLTQADDAHLAGEIEALTRTMKEMDEVYQRIGGGNG
jgi:hypothetical protein